MPCYNAASYISDAINSVLSQTMYEFELLIIDDGSTDHTVEVIRSFKDERICLIRQSQKGIAAALNFGLKYTRAPYIARFDADDICNPDRLLVQYCFLSSNVDYVVVGSAADYIDKDGNYIFTHYPIAFSNEEIQRLSPQKCPFIHTSVMFRKDSVASIGYDVNAHGFEDHLLWLNLKRLGKMQNLPDRLLIVRVNPGSFTIDEKKRSRIFRKIKAKALNDQYISPGDGKRLLDIIKTENTIGAKQGAYHSLLAKKYLWNNYDPKVSRLNMKIAIGLNRFDIKDYLLFLLSYFPKNMIKRIYLIKVTSR